MQKISIERRGNGVFSANFPGCSIECIAHHGMPDGCQMHADLVGPAGVDSQFQQAKLPVFSVYSLLYLVVCDGFASTRSQGGHPRPSHPVAADVASNRATFLLN